MSEATSLFLALVMIVAVVWSGAEIAEWWRNRK